MNRPAEIIESAEHVDLTPAARNVAIIEPGPSGAVTPMDLLNRAVSQGAGLDMVEKLVDLYERWDKGQARKEFDAAIAAAKAEITPVLRNREGHNNKRYADFAAIARAVDPIISKHGLSYRFRSTQSDRISVTCVLAHKSGHCEETTLSGPADTSGNKNAIQAIGSTLSYLQRYSLVQALGLAAADDDDGRAAGADGVITDEQSEQITVLLTETKSDVGVFLKWLRVESVSDIPLGRFGEAIAKLQAKKARVQQ